MRQHRSEITRDALSFSRRTAHVLFALSINQDKLSYSGTETVLNYIFKIRNSCKSSFSGTENVLYCLILRQKKV